MIGQVFGRLTVVERAPTQGCRARWLCECSCGQRKVVTGHHLRGGRTVSCGCARRDFAAGIQARRRAA